MANLQVKDGTGAAAYLKASGAGTNGDPHIPEHKETSATAILAAAQAIETAVEGTLAVSGPLTDTQLRASPVPVSGTVTTGALTDTQLRASPVPVSGPLTDTQLRASAVPVSGTVATDVTPFTPTTVTGYASSAGNNAIIAAPGAGKAIDIYLEQVQNATATATVALIKHGATTKVTLINANKGDGMMRDYGARPRRMAENTAYNIDLDLANSHAYTIDYVVVTL